MLALLYVGTFLDISIRQANNIRVLIAEREQLTTQLQQQQAGINSFISQLQQCEKPEDYRRVLKSIGVEPIKQ